MSDMDAVKKSEDPLSTYWWEWEEVTGMGKGGGAPPRGLPFRRQRQDPWWLPVVLSALLPRATTVSVCLC
ncbi:hypothetical protein E2C01_001737 [Portunus trituberculatus]|uniref:Uncharacterized protein n=1 Tax=Portunus trituberculatus TaxID=210409 RepID=A0A5B7CK76_PORTR|nr:hypothetical protein [Portunus trituberculatus]